MATSPRPQEPDLIAPYDRLWTAWRRRQFTRASFPEEAIAAAFVKHCDAASEHYAGRDNYLSALWKRRAALHRAGKHAAVLSATGHLQWLTDYDLTHSRQP